MPLDVLSIGAIALDTVKTPFGQMTEGLGGTAAHCAVAASFFARTGIYSAVGTDFPAPHWAFLQSRGISLDGVTRLPDPTTRWEAHYDYDMGEAHTDSFSLNAYGKLGPSLPPACRDAGFIFLGALHPSLQEALLPQFPAGAFVALDTKTFWIEQHRDALLAAAKRVQCLILNEWEARKLFQTTNLAAAARRAVENGTPHVIIKKGEHGALLCSAGGWFFVPGYPLESVVDPTGAGDSFAGGFLGFLARAGLSAPNLRKAMVYGSVMASFSAEGFGMEQLRGLAEKQIAQRYEAFGQLVKF